MTLLVRDEAAIIRENIEYHLARGVDMIIATDNLSTDGTTDILKEYESLGCLHYIQETSDDYSQDLWVTRMAEIAKLKYNADWILHTDADEFWWPEGQKDLKTILGEISPSTDGLIISRSNFVTPKKFDSSVPFYYQMIYRQVKSTNPLGKPLPPKVCHRGGLDVFINQGNHSFSLESRKAITEKSNSIIIWHFQYRGYDDYQNKIALGGAAYERNERLGQRVGGAWRKLYKLLKKGKLHDYYLKKTIEQDDLRKLLKSKKIVPDERFSMYMKQLMS